MGNFVSHKAIIFSSYPKFLHSYERFYCTYRKRPNEAHGMVQDCTDIDKTFARHAEMFVTSGIDYIYVDLTNICNYGSQEDGIQRRPMELLFEEWHKLRSEKKQTPQIVAWHRISEPGIPFIVVLRK
jgi:hypothetical protein